MSTYDNTPRDTEEKHVHHHDSAEQDRAKGGLEQVKGRLKEGAGALTGNETLREEGLADQAKGKTHEKKGQLKEKAKDIIDRI